MVTMEAEKKSCIRWWKGKGKIRKWSMRNGDREEGKKKKIVYNGEGLD